MSGSAVRANRYLFQLSCHFYLSNKQLVFLPGTVFACLNAAGNGGSGLGPSQLIETAAFFFNECDWSNRVDRVGLTT